jgi:hypothetical protein
MSGYTSDQVTTNRWDVWTAPKPCVLKANRAYQEDAANKPAAATSWSRCKVKSLADDGNSLVCEMPPLRVDHASYTDEHYDMVSQELYIEVEVLGHRAISTTGIFSYESGLKIDSVEPRHGPTVGGGVLTIKGHNFRHIEYGPRADKPLGGEAEWDGDYVAARFTPFRVTVGDQPCPIMSQSETEIKCVTPPGYGTSHAVKLVVPGVDIVINQQFNAEAWTALPSSLRPKKCTTTRMPSPA